MDASALTFAEYWEIRALDLALDSLRDVNEYSPRIDVLHELGRSVHRVERACFHCLPAYQATSGEAALVNATNLDAMLRYIIRRLTPEEVTQFQRFYGRDIQRYMPQS